MKISGFTLIRNGIQFDYPFLESLQSLLPLVDEMIINVGNGEDDTLKTLTDFKIKNLDGHKIILFTSDWPLNDPEKKKSGLILSEQTNLALDRCTGDWCIYLQADEVFHELSKNDILDAIKTASDDPVIDGLVFNYIHFYGNFSVIQKSRAAYRREVRVFKNHRGIRSIGDAQSFRFKDGKKITAKLTDVSVYHYGWVRTPEAMREKTFFMDQLYHGKASDNQIENKTPHTKDNYKYKRFWGLYPFCGSHPAVMLDRIKNKNWDWDLNNSKVEWTLKDIKKIILDSFEKLTGVRLFEYRSYRLK